MKILFITQHFYPDIQATSKIFTELCVDLAGAGHSVTALCAKASIVAGHGDEGQKCREDHAGVQIERCWFFSRVVKRGKFSRFWGHFLYTVSASVRVLFCSGHDLIVFTSDNPFNFIPAFFANKAPRVFLCQDLYLEQALSVGFVRHGWLAKTLEFVQKASYHLADKIVAIGEVMAGHLEASGVPKAKIGIISNWADTEKIRPMDRVNGFSARHALGDKFVCLHSGRIGLTQDIELILECADSLRDRQDIRFLIVGDGVGKERNVTFARSKGLDNVTFLPYQPESSLPEMLATASVSVITFKKELGHSLVPSRLFSFMASGRPIIATAEKGSTVHELMTAAGCGFSVMPGDIGAFREALLCLHDDPGKAAEMGLNGRRFVEREFSRGRKTAEYRALFEQMAKQTGTNPNA